MELVAATADDLDALVERWYHLASTMEAYDELNELVYEDVEDVSHDGFKRLLNEDGTSIYLVVHDAETIGYVMLEEGKHPSREHSQYLRIVDLVIDDGHRNQGHGTAVLDRVKSLAREWNCDYLKVGCEYNNEDARRFYRDAGFRPKQVDYVQPVE